MTALFRAIASALIATAAIASSPWAHAQSALLQGGPITPGHAPMYVNSYSQQPIVTDSGPAAGGPLGTGLSELGLTARGSGTGPFASAGSGAYGANFCDNDGPTTSPGGYHSLCFSPNSTGYGGVISYNANGGASQLPLTFIQNGQPITFPFTPLGAPLSTVAVTEGLNPLPIGSVLYNWGVGFPSTATSGGVADPLGFYLNGGSLNIYKARTWGTEDRACGLSVVVNAPANAQYFDNSHCGVNGTIAQLPSRTALYNGIDSVSLFSSNTSIAPLVTDTSGTFDATHYYASSLPSSAALGMYRLGMFVTAGGLNGQVTGWSSNGSSITVSGWYASGNQASGQVPAAGSTTYVSPVTAVWSANFAVEWDNTNPVLGGVTGIEQDVYNYSGTDSTISSLLGVGYDAECGGSNACGIGHEAGGNSPWVIAYYAKNVTFAGYAFSPPNGGAGATGFFSNQTTGNVLEESYPTTGTNTVIIAPTGNASFAGNVGALTMSTTAGYSMIGSGGEAFEAGTVSGTYNATISPTGNADFTGTMIAGVGSITGSLTAGGITTTSIDVTGSGAAAYLPTGTAPSGTCPVGGQIEGDASKLYWCPSNGGVWKYAALTTN